MEVFYFDNRLEAYEKLCQWNQALDYLENLYYEGKSTTILNSLVGFSWYYYFVGPLVSQKYADDPNDKALEIWKKYLDIGEQEVGANLFFNFIAGYTLSLHGFLISAEYEKKGSAYLRSLMTLAEGTQFQAIAQHAYDTSKRTRKKHRKAERKKQLENRRVICKEFFWGKSLLDIYLTEIFTRQYE